MVGGRFNTFSEMMIRSFEFIKCDKGFQLFLRVVFCISCVAFVQIGTAIKEGITHQLGLPFLLFYFFKLQQEIGAFIFFVIIKSSYTLAGRSLLVCRLVCSSLIHIDNSNRICTLPGFYHHSAFFFQL